MLLGNLIYQMSSWTRAIVIPLSIVHALNPQRPVPAGFDLKELIVAGVPFEFPNDEGFWSWRNFFLKADRFLKFFERNMWREPCVPEPSNAPSSGCSPAPIFRRRRARFIRP